MTPVTCSGSFYSDFAQLFTNSLSGLGIDWACYSPLDLTKPGPPLSVGILNEKCCGERLDVGQMM